MRGIPERNKQDFYYALYKGKEDVLNSNGVRKGTKIVYYDAVKTRGAFSTAKGASAIELFGTDLEYTQVLITEDMTCPANEHSVLWVDSKPFDNDGNSVPYTHIVTRRAKGIDYIAYAIKKVDVV